MRKILITILLILISSVTLFPQWSNDPNNNLIIGYGLDPHICSDSAGGCYVTYDYESTSYPRKLAVERLDKYGYKPWGTLKQILGELTGQSKAEMIEDGEGGVIISYEDRHENPGWTARIRVQKVDRNGNFLWSQTGVRVSMQEINQGGQYLSTDGDGGCIIAWQDVNYTYYVNRIDRNGNRLWGDNGITLNTGPYNLHPRIVRAADANYYVETGDYIYRIRQSGEITLWESTLEWGLIVATPDGGGILHSSIWNPSFYKLLAQRKDSLGNNLWQEPYVEIADSIYINTKLSIIQYNGYFFYGWMGKKNGINEILQIQGLRNNGTLLFNQGSIPLSNNPGGTTYIPIIPSDSGSCIFISNYTNINVGTFGQKIDTLGLLKWNSNQVLLSNPELDYLNVTTDCIGGAIIGGTKNEFTIVVQQVSKYGNLGEIITAVDTDKEEIIPIETVLYQNFPNPFNSSTIIKYQIQQEGRVRINLYNILGEKILTIYQGEKDKGAYTVSFSSDGLPSGNYFYTLETNSLREVKKLTIIK